MIKMEIHSKQIPTVGQKTKRIKVCKVPLTWIEVPVDIPDEYAISQFIKKQNRSDDLLDRKIFELRYARTNI
jgi:hypothetical protein